MTADRPNFGKALPAAYRHIAALDRTVRQEAADAGVEPTILHLVQLRTSQINGCVFCTDLHSREARTVGETERRLYLVPVWREATVFSERERAALDLAEAMARLSEHQDVPDEVYENAAKVFSDAELAVLVWAATTINALNRLGVTGRVRVPEVTA